MDIDPRLKKATEDFVLTVEETDREIDLLHERDPERADAMLKRLCAVVDETAVEIDRINAAKEEAQ